MATPCAGFARSVRFDFGTTSRLYCPKTSVPGNVRANPYQRVKTCCGCTFPSSIEQRLSHDLPVIQTNLFVLQWRAC